MFGSAVQYSLYYVLIFSGGPLLISSAIGLVVSIVQAATQVQDQAFTYLVKMATVALVLFMLSGWIWSELTEFLRTNISSLQYLGAM